MSLYPIQRPALRDLANEYPQGPPPEYNQPDEAIPTEAMKIREEQEKQKRLAIIQQQMDEEESMRSFPNYLKFKSRTLGDLLWNDPVKYYMGR